MATNENKPIISVTPEQWATWCAEAGYAVHGGKPLIGVSGDTGDGFMVSIDAPTNIDGVNLARAILSMALRTGQAKVKAAETPTATIASEGANSVTNGSYKPGRDRSNDIVDSEVNRQFADLVRKLVIAQAPSTSDADVAATVAEQAKTADGIATLAKLRERVLAKRTYAVSRKGKGGTVKAVAGLNLAAALADPDAA